MKAGSYFARDKARKVSREHTAYTSGENLSKAIADKGFRTDVKSGYGSPFTFASSKRSLSGGACNSVLAVFSGNYKHTFKYNANDGLYYNNMNSDPMKDADGNTRELHTELAKGAIDYTVLPDYRTKYEQVQDRETELVSCPYFTTSLCDLTAPLTLDYAALDSFVVVICVEGKGMIADDSGNEMPIHQGETVLLPATVKSLRIVPEGKLKMLTSCIK